SGAIPPATRAVRNALTPARRVSRNRRNPIPTRRARAGAWTANTSGSRSPSDIVLVLPLHLHPNLPPALVPAPVAAPLGADGALDDFPKVQGGHVLLREPERLVVRHPAVLEGAVEVRDRLPILLRGRLPVEDVREAVQEGGDLLREETQEFLYLFRV